MFLCLWIAFILVGFIKKNSKKVALCQILYISAMMAFNTNNPDYGNGVDFQAVCSNFNNIFQGNPIFNLFFFVFGKFTSYDGVIFIISFLCLLLIYDTVLFYTNSVSLVFSFYLISPFVIDATQFKNFVAMAVWIYSSRFLYVMFKKGVNSKLFFKYVFCVLVASGIHFAFIITLAYLLMVLFRYEKRMYGYRILFVIVALSFVLIVFNGQILDCVSQIRFGPFKLLSSKFIAYKINYNSHDALIRIIVTTLFYLCIVIALYIIKRIGERAYMIDVKSFRYYWFLLHLIFTSALCLPLIIFSTEMYRFQRNTLILIYIFLAMIFPKKVFSHGGIRISGCIMVFLGVCISLLYLLSDSVVWNYNTVFRSLFRI